ncbi:hypothetical protein OG818_23465 [Streptomyces virginiae]|uniref:hypothetical protein n=1 Tax=Streptomyces virginiae TaxID=1961 RepID=UPI002253CB78|nr:hypothetical protein [Streptomyces virginiae]MCX4718714.1 hypothetical protein [Streptomyces virginiae]
MVASGCAYPTLPTVHDASTSELAGDWTGLDGAKVTLESNGRAEVTNLGGQDWDFDRGWGLSGTGTWKLIEGASGETLMAAPAVQISITTVTGQIQRPARDMDEWTTAPHAPIGKYTWKFGMERTEKGLQPYYLAGDPDAPTLYHLKRT